MKALFVNKNVWEVVSGDEMLPAGTPSTKNVRAFRRKQAEALAEITLHVEVPQLSFIQDDDPKVVWDALTAVHQARGMATRLALRRRFVRLQKPEGPMQNFITEARRLALELQEIGVKIDDEDIILVLTRGLPPSYDNFVITLDSTPPTQLTLDYVVSRLLNEESRQTVDTHNRPSPVFVIPELLPSPTRAKNPALILVQNTWEVLHTSPVTSVVRKVISRLAVPTPLPGLNPHRRCPPLTVPMLLVLLSCWMKLLGDYRGIRIFACGGVLEQGRKLQVWSIPIHRI